MPVGFSSAARNLFLLGSSGADAVTNFFKAIDKSSNPNEGYYTPSQIKYNYSDGKFLLSGTGLGNDSFGWVEKRDYDGSNSTSTEEWGVRISPAVYSSALTLTTMELDGNDNVIVVGKYGGVNGDYGLEAPYIAKYSNAGVLDWQSTSSTGDLEYTGVTSDSSGNYYACGNTPDTQISALGSDVAIAYVEKFDSNGNPGWGKAASMPNRDAVLTKIASNNKGAVIAVGYLEDDSAKKGYIVKIDSSTGEVLWDRTIKSQYDPDGLNSYQDVECKDIFIDSSGQIYIVGNKFNHGFIIKYTAEGNIIWQKQTDEGLFNNFTFEQVFSDGETEQAVVFGTVSGGLGVKRGLLSKYSKNGDLVWRRFLESSRDSGLQFDNVSLDADPSFYYLLFCDQVTSGMNPTKYTFGKVSSSGNGLGDFQYSSDGSTTIDYKVLNAPDQIGRLSDGSVSNSSSDLMSYPFTANKLLFDDLATNISNKKRQMDSADNFEYSGSPAIRVNDFQELNLLGDVYSGSGNWLDQSGKGNDGIISLSGPFAGSGYGSGSLNFPGGSTDRLEIANSADFNFGTGAYTIEMFIKTTASAGWLYHENDPNDSGMRLCVGTNGSTGSNDGRIEFNEQVSNADNAIQGSTQINDGQWHHIAVVRGASGDATKLYVDGVLDATGSANRNFDSSDTLYIGARGTYGGNEYAGEISNLRVVKGVQVYTGNFTPPSAPLDDVSGTSLIIDGSSITDTSSNNRTITLVGGITAKNPSPTHNAAGYWEFDRVDDYISVDTLPDFDTITVEMWSTMNGSATAPIYRVGVIKTSDADWPDGFGMYERVTNLGGGAFSNTFNWFVNQWNGSHIISVDVNSSEYTQFTHWVGTYDGSNMRLYKNGVLLDSSAYTDTIVNSDRPLYIGGGETAPYVVAAWGDHHWWWDGDIGDVRVYPRALTPAQVYQNYNATKSKYTYEASSTAPMIGPGTSASSNLLLNYDFGNRATYDPATNKFSNSSDITGSSWSWLGATPPTITPNAAIAPDGSNTAALMHSGVSIYEGIYNDGDFTISAWVKTVDGSSQSFQQSVYLLSTGGEVLTTTHTATGEWQKFTFSGVATSSFGSPGGKQHRYYPFASTADLYVWAPQVEAGNSALYGNGRYVPTYGTSINLSYGINSLVPTETGGTFNDEPKNQFIDGTVRCNGSFEYITFSNPSVTVSDGSSSTVSWTAELWIKPDAYTGSSDIADLLSDGTYRIELEQGGSDAGKIRYNYSSTSSNFSNVALTAGQWNHVVVKFSPFPAATSVSIQAWINNTFALNTGHAEPLQQIANRSGVGFLGRIAELRIYDKDLSDVERENNWNVTKSKYGL